MLVVRAVGGIAANEREIAGGDAIGDAAEIIMVRGSEHRTARHRNTHAGVERPSRQEGLAERRAGMALAAGSGCETVEQKTVDGIHAVSTSSNRSAPPDVVSTPA